MQPLKHAFKFIGASFSLALKHTQLQEPWFTLGLGGLVILFVWFLPVALVTGLIGLTPLGLALIGLLATLALVSLLLWGEVTFLFTARTFANIESNAELETPKVLSLLTTHGMDILSLKLSLPLLQLVEAVKKLFASKAAPVDDQKLWLNAPYLVLPVIAVEDLNLKAALARVRQIIKDNLLRFRADLIKVSLVAGVAQILLLAVGVVLAFVVGIRIADPQTAGPWQRILSAGISMLVAWVPTLLGILFSSYTRACYTTALYQWVRNVQTVRESGEGNKAQPPTILRQVLGSGTISTKES